MYSTFVTPPTQLINSASAALADVKLYVLRLDCMHPLINGNKWFKLKYNLLEAKQKNFPKLLTFGGAYSNHIFATAAAGSLFGFGTIGVIRGEERLPLNPTLSFAARQGMHLVYLERKAYQKRDTHQIQSQLRQCPSEAFVIPSGGCNLNGVRGCQEIVSQVKVAFDTICLACGTGTTLAGIALSLHQGQRVIGFPVLKHGYVLAEEIDSLLRNYLSSDLPRAIASPSPWQLICNYHCGGYALVNNELLLFKQQFEQMYGIPLDYIYTAKMFYGVMDLLHQGFFRPGERLLLLHTGGLQGNVGMEERLKLSSLM
ncbi:MAG TPA: 1-aminocyclopropane-1-carboxylate deaminase [Cyanobacteria bacterium UBA11049]|nr:1-aminocyclopropane-1-carboxylate deaminase [Cyanobacteria bacterium UBA11049]